MSEDRKEQGCSPNCFIATAVYGTPLAEEIDVLRHFRDEVLLRSSAGKALVRTYYRLSPPVASFISGRKTLRVLVRRCLVDPTVLAARWLERRRDK